MCTPKSLCIKVHNVGNHFIDVNKQKVDRFRYLLLYIMKYNANQLDF